MNICHLFGLPDIRELADRVLSGDVQSLRVVAHAARDGASRLTVQADALVEERSFVEEHWSGSAAASAGAKLRVMEESTRAQSRVVAEGAETVEQAADGLQVAQDSARRILAELDAVEKTIDSFLGSLPVVGDVANAVWDFLAPMRVDVVSLCAQMQVVVDAYSAKLSALASELKKARGVVRKDAGPRDTGGDARSRQAALFRGIHGFDPQTSSDWKMAEALDPRFGDPAGTDVQSKITVTRINPVPGAGVVRGDAFISDKEVVGGAPGLGGIPWHKGDNRGFDPHARPNESRGSFYIDYERGVVVTRQNPTHDTEGVAGVGDPTVGVEQDESGRVRLRSESTNPLAPDAAEATGVTVKSDVVVDPHGGANGSASVNGRLGQFPSFEFYQDKPEGGTEALLQREQNDEAVKGTGPMQNLPLDTVEVGKNPEELSKWNDQYHPGQGSSGLEKRLEDVLPGLPAGDPFYNYPLPRQPYPGGLPNGGVNVPEAGQVR